MIPSALAGQLQRGLEDFLRFSFWSSTPGMEHVVDDLLTQPGGLLKGPYVSLKLPFQAGTNPRYFPDVPLPFTPHAHQEQAFQRLGGGARKPTLVATGTGSGKTECFQIPILDHCLQTWPTPGIKAILVYPMNALATDQALRFAQLIHGNDKLKDKVRVGLYVGETRGKKSKGQTTMGPRSVITDRETMQESPPDILLTNYKMLDYLLLRPSDQGIWRDNHRGSLRFLVVDEIHTFDGAQGTDLACLIRRLKKRLQADDQALCCVGTSATLGGAGAATELRAYAEKVFGEPFDSDSVIGESRLSVDAFLDQRTVVYTDVPDATKRDLLDPAQAPDPDTWVQRQVEAWFGEVHDAPDPETWAVELGERLQQHATVQGLLKALGGHTIGMDDLVASMSRGRTEWRTDPGFARLALLSLLGLVSVARAWRPELPAAQRAREATGQPRPTDRFLDVRLQVWQRELRRMVLSVEAEPKLRHSDDLDRDAARRHLPGVHCRECGSMGWVTRLDPDRSHLLRTDLASFYRAFFGDNARVRYLYPKAAIPTGDKTWDRYAKIRVDDADLHVMGPDDTPEGNVVELVMVANMVSTPDGEELSRDCPFCASRDSLTLIGFRAATLTSVHIDQLFAAQFNDDKKLLTFSDSVQDAAHRAGFFGARTWRTHLRIAMLRAIRDIGPLTLEELQRQLGPYWRKNVDLDTWVSTFLAPGMAWLHDWGILTDTGELPEDSDLVELIEKRLTFEVEAEFGLQAVIGRSLEHTGSCSVGLDTDALTKAMAGLTEQLQNEVPGLREITEYQVRGFVVGLLRQLRIRGGILGDSLPPSFIETAGKDTHSFKRTRHLPAYGPTSRLPALLVDQPGRGRFESWNSTWYTRWVVRCFGLGKALTADAASTYSLVLPALTKAGLLKQAAGRKGERIWGLAPAALRISAQSQDMACQVCRHRIRVDPAEVDLWSGVACTTARCTGELAPSDGPEDYFSRLYGNGDLNRIFTEEHTGLLDRTKRESVEIQFKAQMAPAGETPGPEHRRPWFPNLLSCTPTLEMGIDIGDLSTAVLCSVPPKQANYLQRIGRAGRRDGNSLILTVANARPHDQYFFASPEEMMEGEVEPPGVFLDAAAVLERQLTAYCFDRWVATKADAAELPYVLRDVFSHLTEKGTAHFPFNLLAYIEQNRPTLLREFREMFAGAISDGTQAQLARFLTGTDDGEPELGVRILKAFATELKQRDSLSSKAKALWKLMDQLKKSEAKPLDYDDQIDKLDSEKGAYLALVKGINNRQTLEFLTDEGLLPNYAFPESAVRLNSVIWRKKKKVPQEGSKYDTWTYEYARSPGSAISELAPLADFYAGGRKVRINQVDVAVTEIETWRFCDACNHAQNVHISDEATSCPACESTNWKDDGQKLRLLRLRQVFANAPDRESRIKDDQDDRQPRFFQRQVLVDIHDEDRAGAWTVEDDRVPFGFEFIKKAHFREVNFGELTDDGAKTTVAGLKTARPGFRICTRCGYVQIPRKDPVHSLACPTAKKNAKEEIEECLYLYREFASEALRMLLPMTDLSTKRQLNSFVAALQVGLQARFGGSIDHLRTTVYSDPEKDSALRRQYLVLFDTVPGGTGYLKQLVTPGVDGELPIFEAFAFARQRIEGCACWNDPDRDGCYRCLYGYRNARDMSDTSSSVAADLLRKLLDGKGKLKQIESLGDVSISGLMDSVLEVRFVEALRLISRAGHTAKLKPAVVHQKPGYRWALGDAEWLVEPQVPWSAGKGSGIDTIADFVLRPASAASTRKPIAIYLDGWEYHKQQVGHDLRVRMAMLASGQFDVWSFTWADLDVALFGDSAQRVAPLVAPESVQVRAMLQRMGLVAHAAVFERPVFEVFADEIVGDGLPWEPIAHGILAGRMRTPEDGDAAVWKDLVSSVPAQARDSLEGMDLKRVAVDNRDQSEFFQFMAVHDGTEVAVVACLDDRPDHIEHPEFKPAWHGYLQLFQLLRGVNNAWFMTHQAKSELGRFLPIWLLRQGPAVGQAWTEIDEVEEPFAALARKLMDADAPEPVVGIQIPTSTGGAWADAELVWEDQKVAVTSKDYTADAYGSADASWTVLFVEELNDDPGPVFAALGVTED